MNILRVLLPTILCTLCFLSAWVAFPQRSCMIPSPASYRCCCCLVIQSCPTLCDPIDYTQPGSSVHGIFQARKLKFPSPEDLPEPGTEPESPALVGGFFTNEPPGKPRDRQTSLASQVRVNPPSRGRCGPRSSRNPLFPSISQDTRARVSR